MRELLGTAGTTVGAPADRCLVLLADVEGYPRWCGETVRRAELVDGDPTRARVALRLGVGPLAGSFDELMVVRVEPPSSVVLTRVPHEPDDPEHLEVTWRIAAGPPTRLDVEVKALLDVPRLLPLGGLAASAAQDLVVAATRELSRGSPMASASSS